MKETVGGKDETGMGGSQMGEKNELEREIGMIEVHFHRVESFGETLFPPTNIMSPSEE